MACAPLAFAVTPAFAQAPALPSPRSTLTGVPEALADHVTRRKVAR